MLSIGEKPDVFIPRRDVAMKWMMSIDKHSCHTVLAAGPAATL